MKFKVGDRVRILDGSKIDDYAGSWVPDMKRYIGKIGTVERVCTEFESMGKEGYTLNGIGDPSGYTFDGRGLKRVPRRIIIEEKRGKVVARLGKVRATVETESLEDGAKDALNELFKKQCEFKVGDVVEGISDRYCITNKGWIGRVTDICGDGIIEVYGSKGGGRYGKFDVDAEFFKLKIPRD